MTGFSTMREKVKASYTQRSLVLLQCALLLALGACLCYALWLPGNLPPVKSVRWGDKALGDGDFGRYVSQGWWLSQGYGYREVTAVGPLCTNMAPGYPAFLAALFCVTNDLNTIRLTQCGIYLSTAILLLLGLRRYAPLPAFAMATAVGTSPWLASQASMLMSEVLGVFWAAILAITIIPVFDRQRKVVSRAAYCVAAGFSCSALCLTSPVLAPCCFLLICLLTLVLLKTPRLLLLVVVGAALPMGIWQTHCLYATGRPCLTLLNPLGPVCGADWINTWAQSESDCLVGYCTFVWADNPPDFSLVPSYAFRNASEFAELRYLATAAANERAGLTGQIRGDCVKALSLRCSEIARERFVEKPLRCTLILPFQRTLSAVVAKRAINSLKLEKDENISRLWPPSLFREMRLLGVKRACFRLCGGLLAVWAWFSHFLVLAYYVYFGGVLCFVRDRVIKAFCLTLMCSLFAFGALSPEGRRLYPFLPLVSVVLILQHVRKPPRI